MGHTEYAEDKVNSCIRLQLQSTECPKQQDHLTADWTRSKLVENGFTPLPTWQDALGQISERVEHRRALKALMKIRIDSDKRHCKTNKKSENAMDGCT